MALPPGNGRPSINETYEAHPVIPPGPMLSSSFRDGGTPPPRRMPCRLAVFSGYFSSSPRFSRCCEQRILEAMRVRNIS
jgi:hypothetical protein